MTMKMHLDKFDLNRLYESISKQIETYNCAHTNGAHPKWKNELVAIKEFQDRIGKMLDGEEEDPGCGSDCCGASCICHAR